MQGEEEEKNRPDSVMCHSLTITLTSIKIKCTIREEEGNSITSTSHIRKKHMKHIPPNAQKEKITTIKAGSTSEIQTSFVIFIKKTGACDQRL